MSQLEALSPETLFLAVTLMDRFLAANAVAVEKLQLVAAASFLVAAKFEDGWDGLPEILVVLGAGAYTHRELLTMETTILRHQVHD